MRPAAFQRKPYHGHLWDKFKILHLAFTTWTKEKGDKVFSPLSNNTSSTAFLQQYLLVKVSCKRKYVLCSGPSCTYCYKLNICIPPKTHTDRQQDGMRRGAFGRWSDHEDEDPMNGIRVFRKGTPESSLDPCSVGGHINKTEVYEPWRRSQPDLGL